MSVELKAGGNYVVYSGKAQTAEAAFASIMSYLDPTKVVYYWNNLTGLYEVVTTTTTMVPYGCYFLEVTQDCTWTYGADETPPGSVYLWVGRYNIVPYCGPEQPVEDGFASINPFLANWYYCDKNIWTKPSLMVPLGVYAVAVVEGCTWYFVEVFKGTISKMELEYNESRGAIPVSKVPQGKRGLIHIWGRNDMDEAQRMGIYWIVKDPDGVIVEEYSKWEAWPYTEAGKEKEFIGGRFNLDKPGIYRLNAGLLMNYDTPVYVDIYYGVLCAVAAALVPEISQFEIADYIKV